MGGSSLAPEVIASTEKVALTVLDTTDPGQVADALAGDLERTVLVVSSKSGTHGGDGQPSAHLRRGVRRCRDRRGQQDDRGHRPGLATGRTGSAEGVPQVIFLADPHVGGRYSALSAFGLVPAGLAGADMARLLDQAASVAGAAVDRFPGQPRVAAWRRHWPRPTRAAPRRWCSPTPAPASPVSATGPSSSSPSPRVNRAPGCCRWSSKAPTPPASPDAGADATPVAVGPATGASAVAVTGSLGAQFLLWEYAVAVVGRLLRINPFDQPDVEAAKKAARALLDNPQALTSTEEPAAVIGPVEVYGPVDKARTGTLTDVLREFVSDVADGGYLAVQAYLDRLDDASATVLRSEFARRTGKQTTFGWGPRFLHSTGQYHKGGHPNGSFLQITGSNEEDVPVPGRPYSLGTLQLAQALGDGQVLAGTAGLCCGCT